MAIGTAAVVGGAMALGGTAAAIRAARMKTQARGVQYAGSKEGRDALLDDYEGQAVAGRGLTEGGVSGLNTGRQAAQDLTQRGTSIMDSAAKVGPVAVSRAGMSLLDAYKPGAVAAAQSQRTIDQGALQNLGAARSGGALGLRNALNANAGANVAAAQDVAQLRAQEEQALLSAKVGQENADRQAQIDSLATAQAQRAQLLGLGAQVAQGGNAQALGAASSVAGLGQDQQQLYTNQATNIYNAQTELDADYEKRRQAEAQRKSNNLWNLGSTLITGGAKALAGGAG